MATAEKHRKRSHYSARNRIPFGLFKGAEPKYGVRLGNGTGILNMIRQFIRRRFSAKGE